jgi:hypothetical protein
MKFQLIINTITLMACVGIMTTLTGGLAALGALLGSKSLQAWVGNLIHSEPCPPANDDPFMVAGIIRGSWSVAPMD